MRIVQIYSGNEIHKVSLSAEKWQLLQALLQDQSDGANLSQLCCRAGVCPLILRVKKLMGA